MQLNKGKEGGEEGAGSLSGRRGVHVGEKKLSLGRRHTEREEGEGRQRNLRGAGCWSVYVYGTEDRLQTDGRLGVIPRCDLVSPESHGDRNSHWFIVTNPCTRAIEVR